MPIHKRFFPLIFLATDFLAAFLGWYFLYIYRISSGATAQNSAFSILESGLVIATFWTVLYLLSGFYKDVLRKSRSREILHLIRINIIGFLVFVFLLINLLLLDNEDLSTYQQMYKYMLLYLSIHLSVSIFIKLLVMTYTKHLIKAKQINFRTVIIGSDVLALDIYNDIENNSQHLGLNFIGYISVSPNSQSEQILNASLSCLGTYQELEGILKSHKIEEVIIAIEKQEHATLQHIITAIEGLNIRTSIIPDIYSILLGSVKISQLFGTPLIQIKTDLMPVWQQALKRLMDIAAALLVLIPGFPFLFVIAVLTKLSSKGPILFFQERIGKGGKPFKIIKFRSMYIDAEARGPQLSSASDSRVTPWGRIMRKTRLDEFPQFWNVLVGDMSLVGPRPERQHFINLIVEKAPHYKHLNRVRPGITSLGQVKYGYAENVDEMVNRLKFDILYIENMSIAMDIRIILRTILTVIKGKGK